MLELVITLTICHMSSSTHLGLTNVFHQTVTTKPLDNFWHSTGFTPPSSEPEESAEFLLSRGQRGVLTGSDFRNGIAKELKIPLRIRIQDRNHNTEIIFAHNDFLCGSGHPFKVFFLLLLLCTWLSLKC